MLIDLDNGKYTIVYDEEKGYITHILRYREPWKELSTNVELALVHQLLDERKQRKG